MTAASTPDMAGAPTLGCPKLALGAPLLSGPPEISVCSRCNEPSRQFIFLSLRHGQRLMPCERHTRLRVVVHRPSDAAASLSDMQKCAWSICTVTPFDSTLRLPPERVDWVPAVFSEAVSLALAETPAAPCDAPAILGRAPAVPSTAPMGTSVANPSMTAAACCCSGVCFSKAALSATGSSTDTPSVAASVMNELISLMDAGCSIALVIARRPGSVEIKSSITTRVCASRAPPPRRQPCPSSFGLKPTLSATALLLQKMSQAKATHAPMPHMVANCLSGHCCSVVFVKSGSIIIDLVMNASLIMFTSATCVLYASSHATRRYAHAAPMPHPTAKGERQVRIAHSASCSHTCISGSLQVSASLVMMLRVAPGGRSSIMVQSSGS
mmetsp:Transcript_21536/g.66778  ORF Transcript_21536/g.66778 Transcript_21536/m.66778 type:complete len:383 (+) Transcript_21536:1473-2621(+)